MSEKKIIKWTEDDVPGIETSKITIEWDEDGSWSCSNIAQTGIQGTVNVYIPNKMMKTIGEAMLGAYRLSRKKSK